ncbi:MAG: hypothetical protein K2I06_11220 [Ruminococcus sp.]|nr:hypothetical protein [Ruminococcus sp.]
MIKQDKVMYEIIKEITLGEKRKGDTVLRKDYDINMKQMSAIFQKLSGGDIIERNPNSTYTVTDQSIANAQEFCLAEISQRLEEIAEIAESGNISDEMLIEFIRLRISDRKCSRGGDT